MIFTTTHRKQFLRAGPLIIAMAAVTVTACGGGSGAGPAPGSAPGQWTKAEISRFTAAAGGSGGDSQDACITGYFERDMSFGNAMAIVSVDPASGPSKSAAQIKAALVSKYGAAEGGTINAQFERVATDSGSGCGAAAASTAPAALAATPAATSESSCTVDCVNPVASGESGWLAQVQGPLQNVRQDLSSISSDSGSAPDNLTVDGSELEQDDNPAQASQEITAGNAALASFNAANGGVLNGTIQSRRSGAGRPARPVRPAAA